MRKRHHSTAECIELAKKRKGKFLSKKYLGTQAYHVWSCENGHPPFKAIFNSVYRGSWCRPCVRREIALKNSVTDKEWSTRAKRVGFKVLKIKREVKKHTILLVQCLRVKNHKFEIDSNSVKNGRGCKLCANNTQLTIEHAQLVGAYAYPKNMEQLARY